MTILALSRSAQHVGGTSSRLLVVAVRIVRLQDAQAVLDGDAGRDDQEAAGERLAARAADGIDRLPGDQHRHDGGLAGAGGELQREPQQVRVGLARWRRRGARGTRLPASPIFGATSVSQIAVSTASTWQKNGRTPLELVVPPVLEQARRLGRDLPLARVRQRPPGVDLLARTSLMIGVGSYSCCSVESPSPSSRTSSVCCAALLRFFGFGIGVMKSARRRRVDDPVASAGPSSSSSQCRAG